jgi:hypothetical protein
LAEELPVQVDQVVVEMANQMPVLPQPVVQLILVVVVVEPELQVRHSRVRLVVQEDPV